MSAGFPAIVPGAGGDVNVRAVDRGFGFYKVRGVGEELVGEGEDAGAEGGGGEVWEWSLAMRYCGGMEGLKCTYTVGAECAVDLLGGNSVIDGLRSGLHDCAEEALHVHCVGDKLCALAGRIESEKRRRP